MSWSANTGSYSHCLGHAEEKKISSSWEMVQMVYLASPARVDQRCIYLHDFVCIVTIYLGPCSRLTFKGSRGSEPFCPWDWMEWALWRGECLHFLLPTEYSFLTASENIWLCYLVGPGGACSAPNLRAIAKCHSLHDVGRARQWKGRWLGGDSSPCCRSEESLLVISNWDRAVCLWSWEVFVSVQKHCVLGTAHRLLYLTPLGPGQWALKAANGLRHLSPCAWLGDANRQHDTLGRPEAKVLGIGGSCVSVFWAGVLGVLELGLDKIMRVSSPKWH